MSNTTQTTDAAIDLARECLYRFLGALLRERYAPGWELVLDRENQQLAAAAAELLREQAAAWPPQLGFGELPADRLTLEPLLGEIRSPSADPAVEFDRVFGLVPSRECPPYETEYEPSREPFYRSQQLADVAGFYRAFGLSFVAERPDHAALELEFMALLLMKKRLASATAGEDQDAVVRAAVCGDAERSFFRDHLAWWLPSFSQGLRRKAGRGLYAATGEVLAAFTAVERRLLDIPAPRVPLPPALIEAPEEQAGCNDCPGSADLLPDAGCERGR